MAPDGTLQGVHRTRPWLPSLAQLAPLLLLPLLAWFALDAFDIKPHPGQQPVFAGVLHSGSIDQTPEVLVKDEHTPSNDGDMPGVVLPLLPSPQPPPPKPLEYWQKVGYPSCVRYTHVATHGI